MEKRRLLFVLLGAFLLASCSADGAKIATYKINGKTKEITFTTQATPDKKYDVDMLVFENGKKILSGSGTLQSPTIGGTTGPTGAGEGVVLEKREYEKPPTPTPGFETLLLLCAIPIALLFVKRYKRK